MPCLVGCSKPPPDPSPEDGGTPVVPPVQPCTTCTVSLNPKDIKLCGAGSTKEVTATGTPAGGVYTFSSSDTSVATVAGNNNKGTITAVAQGTAVITVTYNVSGCTPCTDTASVKACTCTEGRKYAYANISKANLVGTKAKIKTRYGKLCCEIESCSTRRGLSRSLCKHF